MIRTFTSKTLLAGILFLSLSGNLWATVTKNIGASGDYTTIAAAWAAISAIENPISQAWIFEIQSDYVTESLPITLGPVNGVSATNTITIRPKSGVTNLTISTSSASSVFYINGVDYLTLDGRAGGVGNSQFTLINTAAASSRFLIRFQNDATNNIIKYMALQGSNTSISASSGGLVSFYTATAGGNDNNSIQNCTFQKSGANSPAVLLASDGSVANENNGTLISECEFSDFTYNAISLDDYTSDWTIQNNHFFQTAAFTPSFSVTMIMIREGGGYQISGNYFGGRAVNCGGAAYTLNSSSNGLNIIWFSNNVAGAACTVSGNTIQNIQITSSTSLCFRGFTLDGSVTYQIGSSGNGNLFGATSGTGSITVTGTTSGPSTLFYAINLWSSGSGHLISYNNIGAITVNGTATGSDYNNFVYVGTGSGAATIDNNTIGNSTSANIAIASNGYGFEGISYAANSNGVISNNILQNIAITGTTTPAELEGIVMSGSGANSIVSNTIGNANPNNILITSPGDFDAIALYSGTHTVTGNILQQINHTSTSSSSNIRGIYLNGNIVDAQNNIMRSVTESGTGNSYFIYVAPSSVNQKLVGNELSDCSFGGPFAGIFLSSTGINTLTNNKIGKSGSTTTLSHNSESFGIYFTSNGTFNSSANVVDGITSTSTGSSAKFHGFYLNNGTGSFTTDTVRNIAMSTTNTSSPALSGFYLTSSNTGQSMYKCTINDLHQNNTGSSAVDVYGIYMDAGSGDIKKSHIEGLKIAGSSSSSWNLGMYFTTGSWNIHNNVILADNGGSSTSPVLRGIMAYSSGSVNVYHNTVKMFGAATSGSGTSAAFTQNASSGTLTVRNNLWQDLRTGGSGSHYACRIINSSQTQTYDYNYLEVAADQNKVAYWTSGTGNRTMAQWRTSSGASVKELNGTDILDAKGYPSTSFIGKTAGANLLAIVGDDKDDRVRSAVPWLGAFEGTEQALAVNVIEFYAHYVAAEKYVSLKWDSDGLEKDEKIAIEKSYDGKHFNEISSVHAVDKSNNKSSFLESDYDIHEGVLYYRIRYKNEIGEEEYSVIKSVLIENLQGKEKVQLLAYPNPLTGNQYLNIEVRQFNELNYVVNVYSISGKLLLSKPISSGKKTSLNEFENLPKGTYLLKCIYKNSSTENLIIKQ